MQLEGVTAVVTGGGSGMGLAAAQTLASCGARTCLLGRRLDLIEEQAKLIGGIAVQADVADDAAVEAAFDTLQQHCGTARVLVNAAGMGRMLPLISADGEASDRSVMRAVIETNVLGTLYCNQIFAAQLAREQPLEGGIRGLIINVSSIGAMDGVVGSTYVASKAAVNGLCLSLARELSDAGIRVMTIAPGGIDTPMFREGANEATHELIANSVPGLQRTGRPEEFGALVQHIAQNDYLNGSIIRLDGGMRIPFAKEVGLDSGKPH